MSTLHAVELGVLGPLQVRRDGAPVTIPGAKPRAILTMLGLHGSSIVSAETLLELLWGDDPPRTAAKALQTHISSLRRTLDDGFVLTEGTGWVLTKSDTDASRYKLATKVGRDAAAAGDSIQAVARFDEALGLWRGIPELPDTRRGVSEKTRWIEGYAALVEDRADALLATGRAAEITGELEAAVSEAPLRERRWGQLMLALYRAGRQGEALAAYQRARSLLADELGVDPGPELRRLEGAIVAQDASLEVTVGRNLSTVTRAVTFLLTDIEGSTAAWEADAAAMATALARHDELAEQVVTSRGGRLIKTRGEGDATFSVFDRPSAAAAAALELQDAIAREPWALREPMRIRIALHTGEAELRDGDYFGRAVNRAARLRSLAAGGQILCSGATAELAIDSLPDDVVFADLGMRQLKNLARPEHVFELRLQTTDDGPAEQTADAPLERPSLPAVLIGPGPFVGRTHELEGLVSLWETALTGGIHTVLIAGEPGVGKTRLAGEWSQRAYQQGAVVLYGRCDEDLGAPYQPFAEALRSLVPCMGVGRLRGLRGVEALLALVPGLTDVLLDLAAPTRAEPDTERYALFDAVVALLEVASKSAPVVVVLDDLHWAAKPTLLLLRHLLRFGDQARVQIVGTYRSTDLDRSHPLAAMLADLHRSADSGTANRLQLSGLDEGDVTAYVTEAGYDDEELARALASVTGGNPFFLIEALRHVDESGGVWDPTTLPQGVRETVSRRLSRLSAETNMALAAAAVVGSRFAVDLVERVVDQDLVDAFDEARKAGIVIEEPGGRYRFNHAIVRQSLLAELASVRRMRLHQRIAATLETQASADDELLAELAHHYFECAWAGNATKAVEYCRLAADQAMARLGYEGAAELYDRALHALEELDDELPDRDDQAAELLVARCEALLAAGDVASAARAVSQLQAATVDSARLAAWATCFDGQLKMLTHPERLDEIEAALGAAAEKLAGLDDAAGEATAHTVRAACLARLGRIADCEIALDEALTAARRAREHRRVNAVLAGAPLAALWGPNPVPRAGGRCLDVVRLLRITTDSPAVEATSTRCQAVLEAFRGRGAAARRMIDSARRTVTDLGLRHALLEVEQFAGIVELVIDDPAAAEPSLRKAYNGFRRMGLDADTAETAALLGRACLLLDRDAEAGELCTESERLAGHALKPSIAWRTLRAQLLSRGKDHDAARRVAEAAVSLAERTDALVDHGDACLALATVLAAAGDVSGARAAAERAVGLWERKGAAALVEKARLVLGEREVPTAPASTAPPDAPVAELDNECVRVGQRVIAAIHSEAWDVVEELYAPAGVVESRRKIVGFKQSDLPSGDWVRQSKHAVEDAGLRFNQVFIAVRGERLALARVVTGSADVSPGAPRDEFLSLLGLDETRRIALQVWFDLEDMDAALAELDAAHGRFEEEHRKARSLENAASQVDDRFNAYFAAGDWDAMAELMADDICADDRRRVVNAGVVRGREAVIENMRALADVGAVDTTGTVIATRGWRLALTHQHMSGEGSELFHIEMFAVVEINTDSRIAAVVAFDSDDIDAAIAELDARYLAGEAAAHGHTWSAVMRCYVALNRREIPPTTANFANIDHRKGTTPFAPGDVKSYTRAAWSQISDISFRIEDVHHLSDLGAVITQVLHGTSQEGFEAEWREIHLMTVEGNLFNRSEFFDETDLDAALARFEQLGRPARRLENAASKAYERTVACLAGRDWDAMAQEFADNYYLDDRRRVVNAGVYRGREAAIEDLQVAADIGLAYTMSGVMATRGERLALVRGRASGADPGAIQHDALLLVEVDADGRAAAVVVFDLDHLEAAFAELEARYRTGEAANHAATWSMITGALVVHNRREVAAVAPDVVSIDHRRVASFAPGEGVEYIRAGWDLDISLNVYIETPHRVNDIGGVFTWAGYGTSHQGFTAEWRGVEIMMVDGERLSRAEVFDETDLDAALAQFERLSHPAPRLENAASRVADRFSAYYAAGDWKAMAEVLADNYSSDDRRRVVGSAVRHGRDAHLEDMRARAELWLTNRTSTVVATRGESLALVRLGLSSRDQGQEAFLTELLIVNEINADERLVAGVAFELDDFDAAIGELDRRYLAGEAAAHAHTWSVMARTCASFNQHQLPATTPDSVYVDHRPVLTVEAADLPAYLRGVWDLTPDTRIYIEAVHRLCDDGAAVIHAVRGTSPEGFNAEWRMIDILTVEGDRLSRCEVFDESDLDVALARFDELSRPAPRLENAASQAYERIYAWFAARDWDAIAEIVADDFSSEDRRRVVNAGVRHGRDAGIKDMRAIADVGFVLTMVGVMATRGERLALLRVRAAGPDPGVIQNDALNMVEVDANKRILTSVVFDLDNFEVAIAELDARYVAGEAAAHARTWSVIADIYAAFNRRELPATDWVTVDQRRGTPFASSTMLASIRAIWDLTPDLSIHVEAVHRLSKLGAVITHAQHGTSSEGFDAEWRQIQLLTVEGDRIDRCEIFDEAELDTAVAHFEKLHPRSPRLENAASQVLEGVFTYFAARDWIALAELVAEDICSEDRRPIVNAGIRHGRDAEIADMRAIADVGVRYVTITALATRAEHLSLCRVLLPVEDHGPGSFRTEALCLVEINADHRVATRLLFGLDDLDAAFEELEARYLAGEASPHAHPWSVITRTYAGFNQHEFPPLTLDSVSVDHRRFVTNEAVDLVAATRSVWDVAPDLSVYIETVHRLSELGAVITHVGNGTSPEGFDAEWRMVNIFTVDGDRISRCEIFDEADLDAALARFEELQPRSLRLKSAAAERFLTHFATRDWDAMGQDFAESYYLDDRRRVVNSGVYRGRDAAIKDLRVAVDIGLTTNVTVNIIATRGEHRILTHWRASGPDPDAIQFDVLQVLELNTDERIVACIVFDLDDVDAAFAELDARYLAGDAAPYADAWSVITGTYTAFNRHDLTGADWAVVDHRRGALFASSNMIASVRAFWEQAPDLGIRIEAVHRVSASGAVVTHMAHGTSPEGFDAEWRMIQVLTIQGDRIGGCELFDETDLDAALARFDELQAQPREIENAASRVAEHYWTYFAIRDWDALAEILSDDICVNDRRRVVNAGAYQGRDAEIASLRALAEIGVANVTSTVIATRGERLALTRLQLSGRSLQPDAFRTDSVGIAEIAFDGRLVAHVAFDPDDLNAAFAELDARYLAGEAAAHAQAWAVIAQAYAGFNRKELPPTTPDWVNTDRRRGVTIEAGSLREYLRAMMDATSRFDMRISVVHRLSDLGAVVTHTTHATSQEGLDAEWQDINLMTIDGGLINRCEIFNEADLGVALARFDELQPQPRRLENAASQVEQRISTYFVARDWDAMAGLIADDIWVNDRRRVVNAGTYHGRNAEIASLRALADVGVTNMTATVIAIRGARLVLSRYAVWHDWSGSGTSRALVVAEINAENQVVARIIFAADDFDAAIAEVDARYIAGEAGTHAEMWSLIAGITAGVNRQEVPATTPDSVYIDHRPLVSIEGVDLAASLHALWDITSAFSVYVEAVHRLDEIGTVVTQAVNATMQEGLDAELRFIEMVTVDGDLVDRCECFDEADLDAALARFDELHPQARRLENAASQVFERLMGRWVARDWDAVAEMLADDVFNDDRRRVVNAGLRHGRDATIASMRASADFGLSSATSTVIATRGERLALSRDCFSVRDEQSEAVVAEVLGIVGIDNDERIVARLAFDLDDFDAAVAELDARYVAGEAAPYAGTWSVISGIQAAVNRRELPPMTPDPDYIDHRPLVSIEGADLAASIRAVFDLFAAYRVYVEAVHRLDELGAVYTQAHKGTSNDGVDAELRMIEVQTVKGALLSRAEVFDEADLDVALARFDELRPEAPRLENAASQLQERFWSFYSVRDWDAMAELLADDVATNDRRRVVNAGVQHGRENQIADMRALAEVGAEITVTTIATRGQRLVLTRVCSSNRDLRHGEFGVELLAVVKIDADNRIAAAVHFDVDDLDAAFAELDARYLAGEAADYAQTWTAMTQVQAAYNRHEFPPTTEDWVNIDHRRGRAFAPGDMIPYIRATYGVAPNVKGHLEAVHRLSSIGVVVTEVVTGTSQEGFDFELREVALFAFNGDMVCRFEMFDEADLDAALARFDELDRQVPLLLGNASTRTWSRMVDAYNRRDMSGFLALMTEHTQLDDRRKGLHSKLNGLAVWKNVQQLFQAVPSWRLSMETIAIRGPHLSLTRHCIRDIGDADQPITWEVLSVMEVGEDNLMHEQVTFDPDDIDAAFEELDDRYLAGEAAPYARTWSVVLQAYTAVNLQQLPATTKDWVSIDHRRGIAFAPGDLPAYLRAAWDITPGVSTRIEAVHRLTDLGAVVGHVAIATSSEGFDGEWREITLSTVEGGLISRSEMFDEADLDTALARFDQLDRPPLAQS